MGVIRRACTLSDNPCQSDYEQPLSTTTPTCKQRVNDERALEKMEKKVQPTTRGSRRDVLEESVGGTSVDDLAKIIQDLPIAHAIWYMNALITKRNIQTTC